MAGKQAHTYGLHSMVCFIGLHYVTYVRDDGQWYLMNDSRVSTVGSSLADVRQACVQSKHQPSLLFFHRQ